MDKFVEVMRKYKEMCDCCGKTFDNEQDDFCSRCGQAFMKTR